MEMEFVDEDEFAAIELAMSHANALARPAQQQNASAGPFQHSTQPNQNPASQRQSAGTKASACISNRNTPGTLDCFVVKNSANGTQNAQSNRSPCNPLPQPQQQQQQPPTSATARNTNATSVTFQILEGGKRFEAKCGYNPQIIDAFKTCKDRSYNQTTKTWDFGIGTHAELQNKLQALGNVTVKPLPAQTLKSMENVIKEDEKTNQNIDVDAEMQKLPTDLLESLMPFQKEGVEFAIRHSGRCLIGDEMGLGKTIQAIAIAKLYEADWPLLVIVPSSMRLVWRGELLKWLSGLSEEDVATVMVGKDELGGRITVISYDMVVKKELFIQQRNYKAIICDESHFLKSHDAKRTKVIVPLLKRARRAVLLTGTPALSKPIELFQQTHNSGIAQITALRPALFPLFRPFAVHFCNAKEGRFGLEANGASNLGELRTLLKHVMIRRKKDDVLSQLPAKRRQQVYVQISKAKLKEFKKRMDKMKALNAKQESFAVGQEERDAAKAEQRQMLNELYKDTGMAKLEPIDEYVSDMIHTGYKFLIFAHHLDVLDGIEATVKNNKAKYIRIDGHTPQTQRFGMVERFQNEEDIQVAILSVTAAGQGLTLTAASAVVFAELNWTPGVMVQAEDRAHRIGQQYSVNVHFMLAKGSADDIMWPVIEKKINVVSTTLDGQSVGGLSGDTRTMEDVTEGGQTQLDAFFPTEAVRRPREDVDVGLGPSEDAASAHSFGATDLGAHAEVEAGFGGMAAAAEAGSSTDMDGTASASERMRGGNGHMQTDGGAAPKRRRVISVDSDDE